MSSKNKSLQAVRGWAILFVVLFHFFPKTFPNAYLGVDMFFVVSGLLISRILHENSTTTTEFLYRRLKRIVPLYLLCIVVSLLSLFALFPRSLIDINLQSVMYATTFTYNLLAQTPAKQYMIMISTAQDVFSHTWSLAVEVQFYLLAPILFTVVNNMHKPLIGVVVVLISSLFYYFYIPSIVAFNSLSSRIWQFLCGSSIHYLTFTSYRQSVDMLPLLDNEVLLDAEEVEEREDKQENKSIIVKFIMLLLLAAICLWPTTVADNVARVLCTMTSCGLVFICWKENNNNNNNNKDMFSWKWIVYMGDISYVVYLLHWPVFVYFSTIDRLTFTDKMWAIGVCLVMSAVVHETYEKWCLRLEKRQIFLLITMLISIICLLIVNNQSIVDCLQDKQLETAEILKKENKTFVEEEEVISLNRSQVIIENNKQDQDDSKNLRHNFCNYVCEDYLEEDCRVHPELLNNKSQQIAFVMGNSYVQNLLPLFVDACKEKFKVIQSWKVGACEPLIETHLTGFPCSDQLEKYKKKTAEVKPDVLVMYVRHLTMMPLAPLTSSEEEKQQLKIEANLKEYEKLVTKNIFVLDVLPRPRGDLTQLLNDALRDGRMIDNKELQDGGLVDIGHSRLAKAVAKCAKCQLLDFRPAFTMNGSFRFYDPRNGLSYFNSGRHVTLHGLKRLRKVHADLCQSL